MTTFPDATSGKKLQIFVVVLGSLKFRFAERKRPGPPTLFGAMAW